MVKRYILTDFNSEEYQGIDTSNIQDHIDELNNKINNIIGVLYGEIGSPISLDISLSNVSHSIKNLTFEDNKIYGDVEFLGTPKTHSILNILKEKHFELYFKMRYTFTKMSCSDMESQIKIHEIFTWDLDIETMKESVDKPKQETYGQKRVMAKFNPSESDMVEQIKNKSAELIDLIKTLEGLDFHINKEKNDTIKRAIDNIEVGCMLAVKANFL